MNEVRDLSGQVAIVTGASSGLGESTAVRLAEMGARVALLANRRAAAGQAVTARQAVQGSVNRNSPPPGGAGQYSRLIADGQARARADTPGRCLPRIEVVVQ
ncbi:SDR family NAD(P)-dependent oxidoreductase [Actinopolymorpha alba]|uniref:SDR family NAD(P)-dependent oxidoreductase n=1 Tax=Actinopolymorpha alba TaxID=533267 RepID=UPI0003624426|nr:SDR family NAD(P)-dependent oxidoreductase [Actinopolymorpha alba]